MPHHLSAEYLEPARRTVVDKLLSAFETEQLLCTPLTPQQRSRYAQMSARSVLEDVIADGLITEDTSNWKRLADELEDGTHGLARARHGLSRRWSGLGAPDSQAYSALLQHFRQSSQTDGGDPAAVLARMEQLVGEGHPAQPCAKTSLGLGERAAEVLPELVESIDVRFVALAPEKTALSGVDFNKTLTDHLPRVGRELNQELHAKGLSLIHI